MSFSLGSGAHLWHYVQMFSKLNFVPDFIGTFSDVVDSNIVLFGTGIASSFCKTLILQVFPLSKLLTNF